MTSCQRISCSLPTHIIGYQPGVFFIIFCSLVASTNRAERYKKRSNAENFILFITTNQTKQYILRYARSRYYSLDHESVCTHAMRRSLEINNEAFASILQGLVETYRFKTSPRQMSPPVKFFSKLNHLFLGYVDPININIF